MAQSSTMVMSRLILGHRGTSETPSKPLSSSADFHNCRRILGTVENYGDRHQLPAPTITLIGCRPKACDLKYAGGLRGW